MLEFIKFMATASAQFTVTRSNDYILFQLDVMDQGKLIRNSKGMNIKDLHLYEDTLEVMMNEVKQEIIRKEWKKDV